MNLQDTKRIAPWLLVTLLACEPSGPPLTATDIMAVAPLPGRSVSAAYLTLHNESREAITLGRVSSPQFASVEIHESLLTDGVIRMRRIDSLVIDAKTSATFESGHKHLMLTNPVPGLLVGNSITIQFEYDGGGILIVSTPLVNRE